MKKLKLLLIGGGDRGKCYLEYLDRNPGKFEVAGIAEPSKVKREYFRVKYQVPDNSCFESYKEALELPKFADIAMICTQDRMHFEPAMKAMEKGYDILLEKPVSPDPAECLKIADAAKKYGVKAVVCHELRFAPFYAAVKAFLDSGKIGRITNVEHTEGVGITNMAHSYVRGNWRKEEESAPMILAKCCHDMDILYWLIGKPCRKLQSFGTRAYFRAENAPENAPQRCLDGCPQKEECPWYAPKFYKERTAEIEHFRAVAVGKFNPTDEEVEEALKTSPYGRCVYHCDNDVVDRQIVSMQFGEDVYATLTMSPFNKDGRSTRIMGTLGEIRADMNKQSILFYRFQTKRTEEVYEAQENFEGSIGGGHGGGDMAIMEGLYEYIANGKKSVSVCEIQDSCVSHLMCFAAEESRKRSTVVDLREFERKITAAPTNR